MRAALCHRVGPCLVALAAGWLAACGGSGGSPGDGDAGPGDAGAGDGSALEDVAADAAGDAPDAEDAEAPPDGPDVGEDDAPADASDSDPSPGPGACDNPQDETSLEAIDLGAELLCGLFCFDPPEVCVDKAVACMAKGTAADGHPVSTPCLRCIAEHYWCSKASCLPECIQGCSDAGCGSKIACDACMVDACDPGFYACAGRPPGSIWDW